MEYTQSVRTIGRRAALLALAAFAIALIIIAAQGRETPAGAEGYSRFLAEYADKPFAEQHVAAHRMGNSLYDAYGINGVGFCDSSFAFGCYHGFFGAAVAKSGAGIIAKLADGCRERYGNAETGCTHGIGHGLVEHLGANKLVEALEYCSMSGQRDELFGCTGGVFMEYNSMIIFEGDTVIVRERKPEKGNLLAPCDAAVPLRFRNSCYFEIPLWWKSVLTGDFKAVGNLCAEAARESERVSCWKGWGTVVAENAEYSPEKAGDLCDLIRAERGRAYCRLGVAMRFFGTETLNGEGERVCQDISADLKKECMSLVPRVSALES